MLQINNLSAFIDEKSIFSSLNHTFATESITAILGHNGSGKSSLALCLMGHPRYQIEGTISLHNEDITNDSPSDRHKK